MVKNSKIKRLAACLLAAAMLTGCGSGEAENAAATGTDPALEAGVDDQAVSGEATSVDAQAGEGTTDADDPIAGLDYNNSEEWKKIREQARKQGFMLSEITMLTTEYVNLKHQFSKKVGNTYWQSSDPSVVRVGKNKTRIFAKKPGEAMIEGRSEDGSFHSFCKVTVKRKPKNIIYLTFDDGPSRYSTPKILDILKRNAVHATFFELKPARDDYDLTQRVIDEGHTLAIHGYSHKYDQIYSSDVAYYKNLKKLQRLFYRRFGQWCTQTRFPGGSSNTVSRHYSVGIMSRLVKKVHRWGFLYQDWNVSSGDAGGSNTADEVFKMVTSGIQKGRSNVILMHDFSGNDKTINALQRIIDWGKQHNFVFRAMTPSTVEIHHGVNN